MNKVKNAVILAAGIGERAAPLTYETPKGLLKVHGVPMIERQIEQLLKKHITEIIIVVGYMKEKFDYLIDKYGAELVFNPEFAQKNNLASLYRVAGRLSASYVLMSDNYMTENIFSEHEASSWFSSPFYKGKTSEWIVSKSSGAGVIEEIVIGGEGGYAIQGPAYFSPEFSEAFKPLLASYYGRAESRDYYWEHILKSELGKLPPMLIKDTTGIVYEFENIEELREYDTSYLTETNNTIMQTISKVFGVSQGEIQDIQVVKLGMSNRSFKFRVGGAEYVFRLPGVDTGKLVNRKTEKEAYDLLAEYRITDKPVYFDAESGVKISEFLEGARHANPYDDAELALSMKRLREIHMKNIKLSSEFDIEDKTRYYIQLAEEIDAIRFSDFETIREKMQRLYKVKDRLGVEEALCHGDFAHTNVLVLPDGEGKIIDWEFCGNGDPIMDVAMYAIFAEFDRERVDLALRLYLDRDPTDQEKLRLYLYVSLGAFLWTVWAEYKQAHGSEFGEYPLKMYRYAKEYRKICEALDEAVNHREASTCAAL